MDRHAGVKGKMGASKPENGGRRVRPLPEQRLSRSLEYGVAMLECFTSVRSVLGISELADMLELSRSTTHRYAISLVQLGYLEQDGRRRYRLTRDAARSGITVINTLRLTTPAHTILEVLREKTGATVSMGVLDEDRVIYIHRLYGHKAGQYVADLDLGVGADIPLYCTAIGKALLASLSEREQAHILAKLKLTRQGPKTLMSKRKLVKELARVRLEGFAICDEEQAPHIRSIAKTVRTRGPRPMAISVTAPAHTDTTDELLAEFRSHLVNAAERISAPTDEADRLR